MSSAAAVHVERSDSATDRAHCARFAEAIDPWKRLGIDADALEHTMAQQNCELWVARVGDPLQAAPWEAPPPAGFVLLSLDGPLAAYIPLLGVDPAFHGRGIGRALLGAAEARAFERRRNLFICVSAFNDSAQRFYAAMGYERTGILTDFLLPGEDEWLLRKSRGPILAPR